MPSDSPREIRVLIADDDAHNRQLLGEVCRAEGYTVDLVEDGDAAVARALSGDYHVLLVDASMPGLSGYEVMERLRAEARTASLPIIMITAHPHDASRQLAEQLGVFAYIEKPFRIFDLTQRIRLAVRPRRSDMDPPTLPRVRARRALGDALPRLPSPHSLRPHLRRALDAAARAGRDVACNVLRLESGPTLLSKLGRTSRDAALGAMLAQVRESTSVAVHRSDEHELVWLWEGARVAELGDLVASARVTVAASLDEPEELHFSAGACVVSPRGQGVDPDGVLRATRALATRARRTGQLFLVEAYSPPDTEPSLSGSGAGNPTT